MEFTVGISLILLSISVLVTTVLMCGITLYIVRDYLTKVKPLVEQEPEATVTINSPFTPDSYTAFNRTNTPLENFVPDPTKPVNIKFKTEADGAESMEVA